MQTATFDGSKPNLISKKTIKDIESMLNLPDLYKNDNKLNVNNIGSFYDNYILPNLFPIIVIFILVIYLSIKYVLKNKKEAKKMAEKAKKMVNEKFTWDKISTKTAKVYKGIMEEYEESNWNKAMSDTYIDSEKMVGSYKYK
jgi:uncharacterized membrane protein